jgi:hypothetical protein
MPPNGSWCLHQEPAFIALTHGSESCCSRDRAMWTSLPSCLCQWHELRMGMP